MLCAALRRLHCEAERTWRIRFALLELCKQGRSTESVLRVVVSHCVQMFLIYRPAVYIFGHVFRFIVDFEDVVQEFSAFVVSELQVAAALLPFLVCRMDLDPCPHIFCSDASMQGFAVHRSVVDRKVSSDLCAVR